MEQLAGAFQGQALPEKRACVSLAVKELYELTPSSEEVRIATGK